jgi:hypothetical protein
MTVAFKVLVSTDDYISESDLEQNWDRYRDELRSLNNPDGLLLITAPGQAEGCLLADPLNSLVSDLCFQAVSQLAANEEAVLEFSASDVEVRLTPEGEDVVLTGNTIPTTRVTRKTLLPELVACGERYMALLHKLHDDQPGWPEWLSQFDQAAAKARAQLHAQPN